MTKRTLALRAERLTELTAEDLGAVVGAAGTDGGICDTLGPTVPDVNTCPSLGGCR
ncbi:MAG TPA: hypothetical protein VNQ77_14140 [Frankiaceae bacterium]|nr:hypothetical protein [Frankiaceae bacterium]